jgi:transcriptional regulator with XRE-family HTH domain
MKSKPKRKRDLTPHQEIRQIHVIVGSRLRKYREKVDLSLNDVEKEIVISRMTISRWEHGKSSIPIGRFIQLVELYRSIPGLGEMIPTPESLVQEIVYSMEVWR